MCKLAWWLAVLAFVGAVIMGGCEHAARPALQQWCFKPAPEAPGAPFVECPWNKDT